MKENKELKFENGNLLNLINSVQGAVRSNIKLILYSKDETEACTTWKGIEVLVIPIGREEKKRDEFPFRDDISFISPVFQTPVKIVKNKITLIEEEDDEDY